MSDAGSQGELADLSKLKVADLKKLLKTRGLSVLGNKQELIDRLQSAEAAAEALIEGSDVGDIDEELDREIDEAALDDDESTKTEQEIEEPLKEEVKPEEPIKPTEAVKPTTETPVPNDKPTEIEKKDSKEQLNGTSTTQDKPKHKRITITDVTADDATARKKARLERFNQGAAAAAAPATTTIAAAAPAKTESTDLMAKRAARFAAAAPTKTEVTSTIVSDDLKNKAETVAAKSDGVGAADKMKKRAERFGILSPAEVKKQQLEKLQARKARFAAGATPSVAPTTATTTPAEKTSAPPIPAIKTAASLDEKKRLRAERFKIAS